MPSVAVEKPTLIVTVVYLRNPKQLAAIAAAEQWQTMHPFLAPSCQFRGPTFIPRQGDPTTMPTLVLPPTSKSQLQKSRPSHPIPLPIISREKSMRKFPRPATTRRPLFFLERAKYSKKTLINGAAAQPQPPGVRALRLVCAHAVLLRTCLLKAPCACSCLQLARRRGRRRLAQGISARAEQYSVQIQVLDLIEVDVSSLPPSSVFISSTTRLLSSANEKDS